MNDKLVTIQQLLNAPKNLTNSFGGYKYRSAEGILEAVKPLLKEHKLSLTLTDTAILKGEWHYIKATAILTDNEGNAMKTNAYAREQDIKKGMDSAQVTGAASSYARKYALNGLFAIDDTKDPDTDEHQARTQPKQATPSFKQDVYAKFKENNIDDSVIMSEIILKATGKRTVDNQDDAFAVIAELDKDKS